MTELESYAYGISLCGYWDGSKYRVQFAQDKLYLIRILSEVYDRPISFINRSNRQNQACIYLPKPINKPFNSHIIRGIYDSRGNLYKNRLYVRHTEDVISQIVAQIPKCTKYRQYLCSSFTSNVKFYIGHKSTIISFLNYIYYNSNYYLSEKYEKYTILAEGRV